MKEDKKMKNLFPAEEQRKHFLRVQECLKNQRKAQYKVGFLVGILRFFKIHI